MFTVARRTLATGRAKEPPIPKQNTATKVALGVLGAGTIFGLGLYAPKITEVIHSYTGKPEPALPPSNAKTDRKEEVVIPTTVSTPPGTTSVLPLANPQPKPSNDLTRAIATTTVAGAAFFLGAPPVAIGLGVLLSLPFTEQKEPSKETKP